MELPERQRLGGTATGVSPDRFSSSKQSVLPSHCTCALPVLIDQLENGFFFLFYLIGKHFAA